jgi:hypothetical protein
MWRRPAAFASLFESFEPAAGSAECPSQPERLHWPRPSSVLHPKIVLLPSPSRPASGLSSPTFKFPGTGGARLTGPLKLTQRRISACRPGRRRRPGSLSRTMTGPGPHYAAGNLRVRVGPVGPEFEFGCGSTLTHPSNLNSERDRAPARDCGRAPARVLPEARRDHRIGLRVRPCCP